MSQGILSFPAIDDIPPSQPPPDGVLSPILHERLSHEEHVKRRYHYFTACASQGGGATLIIYGRTSTGACIGNAASPMLPCSRLRNLGARGLSFREGLPDIISTLSSMYRVGKARSTRGGQKESGSSGGQVRMGEVGERLSPSGVSVRRRVEGIVYLTTPKSIITSRSPCRCDCPNNDPRRRVQRPSIHPPPPSPTTAFDSAQPARYLLPPTLVSSAAAQPPRKCMRRVTCRCVSGRRLIRPLQIQPDTSLGVLVALSMPDEVALGHTFAPGRNEAETFVHIRPCVPQDCCRT